VTEAAILVNGDPLEDLATTRPIPEKPDADSVYGLTKLLMELHVQFDIVEPDVDLMRYRMLVLPSTLSVDKELAKRLREYLKDGGAIVVDSSALRLQGSDTLWADDLGLTDCGESPFAPAFMKLDREENGSTLFDGLSDYEYALYDGSLQWKAKNPGIVLARLGEPLFQRSPTHYTSHAQTPFDHLTDYAVVVRSDRFAATAFPIGSSYFRHGYWIYLEVFRRLVLSVLLEPLIETNAPISAEVTVTNQRAEGECPERWLVHIVNFSPNRRSPQHCEYLEDPIPLNDVRFVLRVEDPIVRAYVASDGTSLPLRKLDDGWEVVVPRVECGAIAVFER
jgi:hypothetical protein